MQTYEEPITVPSNQNISRNRADIKIRYIFLESLSNKTIKNVSCHFPLSFIMYNTLLFFALLSCQLITVLFSIHFVSYG